MQINFGVGTIIGQRIDIADAAPSFFGVAQEISITFDQTLKELMGQYKLPVDVAPANMKISGTIKYARIQASQYNDMLFGETVTDAGGIDMAVAEPVTSATPSFTVTNATTFTQDLGVFYADTGQQLKPVASAPTGGQYIPGAAGVGSYTIAAADENKPLLVYYSFTTTNQKQITMSNLLMGQGPSFSLYCNESYVVGTQTKKINLKLNACRAGKMAVAFKNGDYTIPEMDFQAFADQSNNWGILATTE